MRAMNIILTLVITLIGYVSAQITITSPDSNSVFVAGQDSSITWQTTTTSPVDIFLMRLIFGSFTKVITIGTAINPASGSFKWSVPTNLDTPLDRDIYKVVFNSTDFAPNGYIMDGFFTIASPTSSAPSSSSPPPSPSAPTESSLTPSSSSAASSSSPSSSSILTSASSNPVATSNPTSPGDSTSGTELNPDQTSSPTEEGNNHNDGLSPGAIAGIVVGGVGGAGLIVLFGVLFCVYKRRESKHEGGNSPVPENKNAARVTEEPYQTRSFVPPYVITTGQEHYHSAQYVPPSNGHTSDQQYYTNIPHSRGMEHPQSDIPHSMDTSYALPQDASHSAGTVYPPAQIPNSVNQEYYGRGNVPHTMEAYHRPNYQEQREQV